MTLEILPAGGFPPKPIRMTAVPPSQLSPLAQSIETGRSVDRNGTASDAVFFGILYGLEVGSFVPGQRLVETDLVLEFGVGRNSVREALQRLGAEGIVDLLRHRGAVIRRLSGFAPVSPDTVTPLD